jgi:hypothetical protein
MTRGGMSDGVTVTVSVGGSASPSPQPTPSPTPTTTHPGTSVPSPATHADPVLPFTGAPISSLLAVATLCAATGAFLTRLRTRSDRQGASQ